MGDPQLLAARQRAAAAVAASPYRRWARARSTCHDFDRVDRWPPHRGPQPVLGQERPRARRDPETPSLCRSPESFPRDAGAHRRPARVFRLGRRPRSARPCPSSRGRGLWMFGDLRGRAGLVVAAEGVVQHRLGPIEHEIPIPSPRSIISARLLSISEAASASRPRRATSPTAPYGPTLLPVASVAAWISSTSDAAAVNSPANRCTYTRWVRASGNSPSAPVSRASRTCRSESASHPASSHGVRPLWSLATASAAARSRTCQDRMRPAPAAGSARRPHSPR